MMNKKRFRCVMIVLLVIAMLMYARGWQIGALADDVLDNIVALIEKDSDSSAEEEQLLYVEESTEVIMEEGTEESTEEDAEENTEKNTEKDAEENTEKNTEKDTEKNTDEPVAENDVIEPAESEEQEEIVAQGIEYAMEPVMTNEGGTETGVALPLDENGAITEHSLQAGTLYLISDYTGWIALAQYSQLHDLTGYRFAYDLLTVGTITSQIYDLASQTGFTGLGSETYPFKGELFSNYAVDTITLKLNRPLFNYLSIDAKIYNHKIEMTQSSSSCAGLAEYLVVKDTHIKQYENIHISGTIEPTTSTGSDTTKSCVGGLFAHVLVDDGKTLTLQGNSVSVAAKVKGQTAGGLIGELQGSTTINLEQFDISSAEIHGIKNNVLENNEGCVGGLIGSVNAAVGATGQATLTLQTSNNGKYTYVRQYQCYPNKGNPNYENSRYGGGLFGRIQSTDVEVKCPITYVGDTSQDSIVGYDAGAFAGNIENSTVTLYGQFICRNVRLTHPSDREAHGYNWEAYGIGLFAGNMKDASIRVAETYRASDTTATAEPAVLVQTQNFTDNVSNSGNTYINHTYNKGFLIGRSENSDLLFSNDHPCQLESNKMNDCTGNMGGAVGYFSSSSGEHSMQYIIFSAGRRASLINRGDGYTGGMVGQIYLSGTGNVKVSNCQFNGTLNITTEKTPNNCVNTSVGILVGAVLSDQNATGKVEFEQDSANASVDKAENTTKKVVFFGGVAGKIDADFVIQDTSIVATNGIKFADLNMEVTNFGGLVGAVENTSGRTRKGQVIGNPTNGVNVKIPINNAGKMDAYGGLFGSVESAAISLSGRICEEGQKTYLYNRKYPTYAGSIVGKQNHSLVYREPNANIIGLTTGLDEVGNYGGVIRNGSWDTGAGETGQLLIQDFQVTGSLTETMDTTGDLLRFAIAMNTEGKFLPVGNQGTGLDTFEAIRQAEYKLIAAEYDLTSTGITCLTRNDETGLSAPFQGSFIGANSGDVKTKIIYNVKNHGQPYNGLFAFISAKESGSNFQNLDLQYSIIFEEQSFDGDNLNRGKTKYMRVEQAGGLAAMASGTITLQNVSYTGTITDVNNSEWDATNLKFGVYDYDTSDTSKYVDKSDDYMGGIFGCYEGADGKSLTMKQLTCNPTFTYQDYTHVMGGAIGYVDVSRITSNPCDINIGDGQADSVSLAGSIQIHDLYNNNNMKDELYPIRVGGLIAQIGTERSTSYVSKCNLNITNIKVDGLKVEESQDATKDLEVGGLLGWQWTDVDVNLSKGEFGNTSETGLKVNAPFGGLVHTVSGKMKIQGITIGSKLTMNGMKQAVYSNKPANGLLVRNGQYLYLEVIDFDNANQSTNMLSNCDVSKFDELVGFTKGGDDTDHGGIVSLGKSDGTYFLGRGSNNTYASVSTQYVQNPDTRYYYDLNQLSWAGNPSITTLNSTDAVMRWHLLHYANAYLRSAMDSGYTTETQLPTDYTISGKINLSGCSIYPTPVSQETYTAAGAEIIWDAQSIVEGEYNTANSKYPDNSNCQHYQMQAGLFGNVYEITMNGLKMSGSYSTQTQSGSTTAGALVAGSVCGIPQVDDAGNIVTDTSGKTQYQNVVSSFQNIELSNLWCTSSSFSLSFENPIGLMIADISSGAQAKLDGISMTGYEASKVSETKKAASALIGNVGGEDAIYISLTFLNMDIADAAQDKGKEEIKLSKSDEAFAKASFIYSYEYAESCNGIYTFTYDAYKNGRCVTPNTKKVTLGRELGQEGDYAVEEYFDEELSVGQMRTDDIGITFRCNDYLPYVYKAKKILVNPKAGDLTVGCGTYEDPYVISSTRQLLSLYRYLYEEDKFETIFATSQWKVNPTGRDDRTCDKTNKDDTGHGQSIIYQTENFPTKEQLSQAYYQIDADIDLSAYPEFTGFGTVDMPFTGVFVGATVAQMNAKPVISMPVIPTASSQTDFGWIKYAKGCVVKDLTISFSQPVPINQQVEVTENGNSTTKNQGGVGGGVIATILGGENIIDNVKVTGATGENGETAVCFQAKNEKAEIGGYVGRVNAGGLILRNVKEELLTGFKVLPDDGDGLPSYWYTCLIVGRVYDGYVVYDGGTDTGNPLMKNCSGLDFVNMQQLPQSRSYDIVNGAYLKGLQQMTWNSTSGFGNIVSDKQLQVLSMALNAGLLNYNTNNGYTNNGYLYDGYDCLSRQRSGNYDYVGNVNSNESDTSYKARADVAKYDNKNEASQTIYHSYLSQFFKDWDSTMATAAQGKTLYSTSSVPTFSLTGTTYDMSVYNTAFRGLGAHYFAENYESDGKTRANVFHGNLMGQKGSPAQITLSMLATDILDVKDVALLNNVKSPMGTNSSITISNITLKGKVTNTSEDSTQIDSYNKVGQKNAAALISTLSNYDVTFNNVSLGQMTVESQRYAAGMVALNNGQTLTFNNCKITGIDNSHTKISGYADVGGFVGFTNGEIKVNANDTSAETSLKYLEIANNSEAAETKLKDAVHKNVGGLIGTAKAKVTIQQVKGNQMTVTTSGDKKNAQIGGMIGYVEGANTYKSITLTNLTVTNTITQCDAGANGTTHVIGTGGIVGAVSGVTSLEGVTIGSNKKDEKILIQNRNDNIPAHHYYGNGGLVGRVISDNTLTATDCHILGTVDENGKYTTTISGRGSNVAGIVGNSFGFTGTNLTVENVCIDAARHAAGIVSWRENSGTCNLTSVSVKNIEIKLNGNYTGETKDAGGIVSHADGKVTMADVSAERVVIASENCDYAGGLVGDVVNSITISASQDNSPCVVNNCTLLGTEVGGAFGKVSKTLDLSNITITNNKVIACCSSNPKSLSFFTAGGFAGIVSTDQDVYMRNITIENNLVSSYGQNEKSTDKYADLGGLCGYTNSKMCADDVNLTNNAIGMMKVSTDSNTPDKLLPMDDAKRLSLLQNSVQTFRSYLYFTTKEGSSCTFSQKRVEEYSGDAAISEKYFYQYSYLQGAVYGKVGTGYGISKVINLSVTYDEGNKLYRPVSDVGASSSDALTSNDDMYDKYREKCVLVYDGKVKESTNPPTIHASGSDVPYVFGNIESIMEDYTKPDSDRRMVYRLGDNYQNGASINRGTSEESGLNSNLSLKSVYQNTYKNGDTYRSPYKKDGKVLPMIVYQSSENGTLDQVLQSYINILTNNSGGLNSYINTSKESVLSVTSYAMKMENGAIVHNSGKTASVSYKKSDNKYTFSASTEDDYIDEANGTFSLIEIKYGWVQDNPVWTLYLPVYVEKRLKVTSNMKLMEGIRLNTAALIEKGQHVQDSDTTKSLMILPKGSSYSVYAEFLYEYSDKFTTAAIPKSLSIENGGQIYFLPKTRLTLIPLDEAGKAYYYTVPDDASVSKSIEFERFQDADGKFYRTKNMADASIGITESDKDICGTTYTNVKKERFVILVDTSDTDARTGENKAYELHVKPSYDFATTNPALYSRTDYTDHCYGYINEIVGASYKINTSTDPQEHTYLESGSSVTENGRVGVHLQYDINADPTYWKSVTSTDPTYMDVGFSLVYKDDNVEKRVPLPAGTTITLGTGERQKSLPVTGNPSTVYYYQSMRQTGTNDCEHINVLNANVLRQLDFGLDFSNADLSSLKSYSGGNFYVVAQLVVMEDMDLPAAGEEKDSWEAAVNAEFKSELGFALDAGDMTTLGMNRYAPADSDSGVIPYTVSIAFPENNNDQFEKKYYTMVYQIEEKVLGEAGTTYTPYLGNDISLYLGTFSSSDAIKAAESATNSRVSGRGVTAVTYQFSTDQIQAGRVEIPCTLVAGTGLDMTNYRVTAYLKVTDEFPNGMTNLTENENVSSESNGSNESGVKLVGEAVRTANWQESTENLSSQNLKYDYFVFTVAKIKTAM